MHIKIWPPISYVLICLIFDYFHLLLNVLGLGLIFAFLNIHLVLELFTVTFLAMKCHVE